MGKTGNRKAKGTTRAGKARPRAAPPTRSQAIKQLKALVERRKQDLITGSWELGKLSTEILKQANRGKETQLTTAALAVKIGLIKAPDPAGGRARTDDSTLRQMMKFAQNVTESQAQKLQKAGIPWRGIVYWLGVENAKQRNQLYRKMLSGLRNSTEIRGYIDTHFKKAALPRRHPDLARMCQKVQAEVQQLSATLEGFTDVCDRGSDAQGPTSSKGLRAGLDQLDETLQEVARLARTTRTRIRRRR